MSAKISGLFRPNVRIDAGSKAIPNQRIARMRICESTYSISRRLQAPDAAASFASVWHIGCPVDARQARGLHGGETSSFISRTGCSGGDGKRSPVGYYRSISNDWKENLRVVMVATRNPLNIGAAARAMANFGFARLRVVNAYDVAFREARSAVGAAPLLQAAEDFPSLGPALADSHLVIGTTSVGHRQLQHPIRRLEYGARLIRRAAAQAPVALLFGSEKFGLSNDDLSHCHWLMRIPTVDADLSMNLGQAVALCLYELSRDPKAVKVRPVKIERATAGQLEQITSMLLDVLQKSGYVNPVTPVSTEEKIRRLVRRLDIAERDVPVFLGMLHQILWKVAE